jgi:hypothetical protein
MVMLSQFLHHRLVDANGQRATLLDFAVDLSTGDYPTVTHMVLRGPDRRTLVLPWAAVQATDWTAAHIQVADLEAAPHGQCDAFAREHGDARLTRRALESPA